MTFSLKWKYDCEITGIMAKAIATKLQFNSHGDTHYSLEIEYYY